VNVATNDLQLKDPLNRPSDLNCTVQKVCQCEFKFYAATNFLELPLGRFGGSIKFYP
jgi:hypothetical protein